MLAHSNLVLNVGQDAVDFTENSFQHHVALTEVNGEASGTQVMS
jgi:hypothetical protein